MSFEEVPSLRLEMIEIRIRWKRCDRHDELPFLSIPGCPHLQAESLFMQAMCYEGPQGAADHAMKRTTIRPRFGMVSYYGRDTARLPDACACSRQSFSCFASAWT